MKPTLLTSAFAAALGLLAAMAPAAAQDEPVYGSQMMTQQERNDYRDRMRSAASVEEREQIRREHHARMVARAKERGVTLPEQPPTRGAGMGPGMGSSGGMGSGMGPGRGMGPGNGTGPGSGRGQ